ncbi:MAG: glycogen synthase GlgA [Candidatus Ancaeobacter aquaticus]|nr:glycogen synthase GlgA [Candidatus Ancaeobacter aquaticus]
MSKKLNILFAASEVAPFAKTGGLADVAGALPLELEKLGHDVCVVLPYYKMIKNGSYKIENTGKTISVKISDKDIYADIYTTKIGKNVTVYLVGNDSYYDRDELYRTKEGDYADNAERFIFFSKAIIELAQKVEFKPDIMHLNDWQTGLVPILLKYLEKDNLFYKGVRTIFTIHNLAYQGLFWHLDMHLTNLPWDAFTSKEIEYYGKINLLKAGIVGADIVTTVSKKYCEEIQTPEYGCGLEGVLKNRKKDLYGILNGVDYNEWSPEKDRYIAKNYSLDKYADKFVCRQDLLSEYKLSLDSKVPVIGVISRLADQKGFDLIEESIDEIITMGYAFILLGTGEQKYHDLFTGIAKKYPKMAGIEIGFNNALAHKIEAGCDFFLMPSRFEPCGLNQIYSLKYGTIPVVRATGGLDDTICDFNPSSPKGNGFKFDGYTSKGLLNKLKDAMKVFKDKTKWNTVVENAMKCDFSWKKSAQEYVQIYTINK